MTVHIGAYGMQHLVIARLTLSAVQKHISCLLNVSSLVPCLMFGNLVGMKDTVVTTQGRVQYL